MLRSHIVEFPDVVPVFTPGNHQCLEEEAAEERESGARIISADANDFTCIGFYRGHGGAMMNAMAWIKQIGDIANFVAPVTPYPSVDIYVFTVGWHVGSAPAFRSAGT